ncbi:MAG: class III extradiol ring-cleavage dioxygenase [Myxococcales bacterium]|nr:class III extradiol ring-cleavage dioxygenase [Myxococcales bacterium]
MSDETKKNLTRRDATLAVAGLAGAAAVGGVVMASTKEKAPMSPNPNRMPLAFVPHGGGPWPFVDVGFGPKDQENRLREYLVSVGSVPKTKPKALLVISAHWEEAVPTVMTSPKPPMLYDYSGFPPESYQVQWPAPGAPDVAKRVRSLLEAAGIPSAEDNARGFDHGTFVPFKLAWPNADIPTLQLSLKAGLDPAQHLAIGRALAPLRDEGVFILGSGMTFHNLRTLFNGSGGPASEAFDAWLQETMKLPTTQRDARLIEWSKAPGGRASHPREEHLVPLMVIAGAAGDDPASIPYADRYFDVRLSAYHFG